MLSRNVYPQTRPGKWSVVLLLAVFLFLVASALIVQSGQPLNFDTLFASTWGTVFSMSAIATALVAFVVGLYTILCNHERSVAVFFTVSLGGLVALFVIMQLFM